MDITERIMVAFAVMTRWEVLVTLVAFALLWIVLRNIADPWAKEGKVKERSLFKKPSAKAPPPQLPAEEPEEEDAFPD